MQGQVLIIGSAVVIALVIVIVILQIVKKLETKYYKSKVKDLEIERNVVASTPVLLELSKVEPIIKNDKMEEKYNGWQEKFVDIKENKLTVIDDMLIDLDVYVDKRDYKNCGYRIAKIELELYKVKEAANNLLDEIRDITLSEEKYRSIVIKLKSKYRELRNKFNDDKDIYEDLVDPISLQLENIESKFMDFEKVMEKNDYVEVVNIVKALDAMISHIEIIINEAPDVLLMAKQVLPKRMEEIETTYKDMVERGYPLDYLNIDYNLEESRKNIDTIMEKVKLLNLENCMFDLKTMLNYYDSLFIDFEKERLSRKAYEEALNDYKRRISKVNTQVKSVFDNLDNIKNTYNLSEEDINDINDANKILVVINDDYKKLLLKDEAKATSYSGLQEEISNLSVRLNEMQDNFNKTLKSLGNMYDDEERAREQLTEIEDFLKQSKSKIHSYKLPVITDNYFVELEEANEAIAEVVNELQKKPIEIKTLNVRVDTARDLVLKLYNTTNEMIKTARMAEVSIVYGNRYRSLYRDIDRGLLKSENEFFKGNYKNSLDYAIKSIQIIDKDIYQKLLSVYDK